MDFQQIAQLPGRCHILVPHIVNTVNENQMAQQAPVIDACRQYDDSNSIRSFEFVQVN